MATSLLRTIETLAEVRGTTVDEVARLSTENAARLFALPALA